ncbi:hypothetical protein ABZP36_024929 [Zizania latifolia]
MRLLGAGGSNRRQRCSQKRAEAGASLRGKAETGAELGEETESGPRGWMRRLCGGRRSPGATLREKTEPGAAPWMRRSCGRSRNRERGRGRTGEDGVGTAAVDEAGLPSTQTQSRQHCRGLTNRVRRSSAAASVVKGTVRAV